VKAEETYRWLADQSKEIAHLDSMRKLLTWDERTHMPLKGNAHRASQLGVLAGLLHERRTNPRIGELLDTVEGSNLTRDPLSVEAVNVREWRRSYDRLAKIPTRLAVELARAGAEGKHAWQMARPRNDWESFEPYLERIVGLKREQAEALSPGGGTQLYDALLEDYEPGETTESLKPVFTRLRDRLVELLHRIDHSRTRPDTSILHGRFPVHAQKAFALDVIKRLGYDLAAGRMDVTSHPFTMDIGPGDVRITTRYEAQSFNVAFFGAVHEAGHGLYAQGLPSEHWGSPMGQSVSLGIHESQSRMWENMVARSLSFWKHFYPIARRYFPPLTNVSIEEFHFALNGVRRSLIRTEADEVTYNLHIMVRFELELALMGRDIEVRDLPGAWNEKMRAYLDIEPPDHASGAMQDIHWSEGAVGYFPTYTLGNLYAAQFMASARKDLGDDLDAQFERGEFAPLLSWLRHEIHGQGKRYRPRDLLKEVTGEDLSPTYLLGYFDQKFGALYNL
jgi:carboxypeptidase Taq